MVWERECEKKTKFRLGGLIPLRVCCSLRGRHGGLGHWCWRAHRLCLLPYRGVSINVLRHEAEFYGITPLGMCDLLGLTLCAKAAQRQSVFT